MKRTVAILGLVGLTVSLANAAASPVAGTTAVSQSDSAPSVSIRQGDSIAGQSVPERFARASGRVADVVDLNSDVLAGSYYADGKLFVGSTGALGDALIEKLAESLAIDVDLTRAAHSLEKLKAFAETYLNSLNESKNLVTSFGAIPDGTGFYLVTAGTPDEEERQDLITAANDSPVSNIVVLADSEPIPRQPLFDDSRAEDSSPYYGGMGYFANSGAANGQGSPCTSRSRFEQTLSSTF